MKIIVTFCCLFCCWSCHVQNGAPAVYTRTVTDVLGREVALPDSIKRIVCIRSGAIRLVTYAGGAPLVCGVEEQECRQNEFTHTFAHPELAHRPVIGPAMGGDAELILSVRPDVIFMSATTIEDADALQKRTNIPVFALEYGDMHRNRPLLYRSLRQIGQVLHTKPKVDSLLHFIDGQIAELRQRTDTIPHAPRVYVGGISYRGQKDITSTDPYYAAFEFIGARNVAARIDSAHVSPVNGTYIDREQLIDWNPDVIFIDAGGLPLVEEDFRSHKSLNRLLSACRNGQLYTLWPYNNHHANLEVMLINAWYAGKVLYPGQFADISIAEKADEILTHFVGRPIQKELCQCWGPYRNISHETPLNTRP